MPLGRTVPWFGVTRTVKVTSWPNVEALWLDETMMVAVEAWLTVCVTLDEMLVS